MLPEAKHRSLLSVFLGQFQSPLIYLLFVAAAIALALGHVSDAAVIFTVVLLNAFIGAFQEGRAERALEALRKLASHQARVVRGGQELMVEAREVVPGMSWCWKPAMPSPPMRAYYTARRCRLRKLR